MEEQIIKQSIEMRSEKIITKLKAISSIKAGDKWNTYCEAPDKPGIFQQLTRTFWYINEERNMNIADLNAAIDAAFEVMEDIHSLLKTRVEKTLENNEQYFHNYRNLVMKLTTNLLQARTGICNLKVIYHDNEASIFMIENIVKKITETLSFYTAKFRGLEM